MNHRSEHGDLTVWPDPGEGKVLKGPCCRVHSMVHILVSILWYSCPYWTNQKVPSDGAENCGIRMWHPNVACECSLRMWPPNLEPL